MPKKCPRCGAKIETENELIVQQKYSTNIIGKMDGDGRVEYPGDVDLSRMDLEDCEDGEPEILGCEKCD